MDQILYQCPKKTISIENKTYDICLAVLRQRQKRRAEALELFVSILRGIILVKSLKLTRFVFLLNKLIFNSFRFGIDRIFVAFCGLVTSIISLLKIVNKGKKEKNDISIRKHFQSLTTNFSEDEARGKFKRRLLSASTLIKSESMNRFPIKD